MKSSRDDLRRSLLRLNATQQTPANAEPTAALPSCCGGAKPPATEPASCCGGSHDGKKRIDFMLWGSVIALGTGIAVHLLWPGAPAKWHHFAMATVELLAQSWWGLLFGIIAMAVLGRVPRELVAAVLGRGHTISGLFRATLAGLALDLCNHGILMVGMGLYKRGASLGQTLAFLIASPWNSLSLTLILAALIGWKWMFVFMGLSAVIGLLTGFVADRLVAAGKLPANPHTLDWREKIDWRPILKQTLPMLKPTPHNAWQMLREGVSGSRMILRWLLFGFVLTALLRTFVDTAHLQSLFGPTLIGMLLTLIATTIMEVCSEGSSPIAADLLTRAGAPGNAFVFLMAGASTDYTEILSLRGTTGSWKIAFALPLISVPQVLLLGWILNHFRP